MHISELAGHHVELPDQVVNVNDDIFVKVIDIDLERRRISLSLKQANENTSGANVVEEFDPYLYGMAPAFDEEGNYTGPEGFDPQTGEWKEGFEHQREAWEQEYAEAQQRCEAHRKQIDDASTAEQEAMLESGQTPSQYSSDAGSGEGTLATDEALQAIKDKMSEDDEPAKDA